MRHQTLPSFAEAIQDRLDKRAGSPHAQPSGVILALLCVECGMVIAAPTVTFLTLHMDTKTMNCHYCGWRGFSCLSQSVKAAVFATTVQGLRKPTMNQQSSFLAGTHSTDGCGYDSQERQSPSSSWRFGRGSRYLVGNSDDCQGLDFPNVTLVGVLNADTVLNLPDFVLLREPSNS